MRASVGAGNEIGELGESFNRMAGEIRRTSIVSRPTRRKRTISSSARSALAKAIDAKDPYTRGHSVRVNKYSVIIARYMNLTERR